MPDLLADLQPRPLWRYFLELSRIPRGSRNEAAAAAWAAAQGRALGLEVERDAAGNVLVRKAAAPGREDRPTLALQAHVDMVCEKNEGTAHDFEKDPIDVWRDGDVVRARGTTLGADNGIGVAAALAALAARDLAHGPLEALFTVDEETGLTGAKAVRPGWLRARYLLNLDSEEEGELTIGCAGGMDTVATRRPTRRPPPPGRAWLRVRVTGLRGGHSGIDIAAGRGNALRLLAQVLDALAPQAPELAALRGGNKRNAIPREASAVLGVEPAKVSALRAEVTRQEAAWRGALGAFDPGLAVRVEDAPAPDSVLAAGDARALVALLLAAPHGVEAMSPDIAGLVQTSTNLAIAETRDDALEVALLTRSSIDASKDALGARIVAAATLAGFEARHSGGYPGWKPEPAASLVKLIDGAHQELFGKRMIVKAIHAGLECGLIGEKYPALEMASIGPSMWDVHTPDERVSVASVQNFWTLLRGILERV